MILFSLFGLIQLSDFTAQIARVNLATFYAARAHFVDSNETQLAQKAVDEILHSETFHYTLKINHQNATIDLSPSPFFWVTDHPKKLDPLDFFSWLIPSYRATTPLPQKGNQ